MPTPPTAKLVEPGQARTIRLYGVRFDYKVDSADSGGDLAVLQVEIPPRTLVKPHNHTREDEFTHVLAGTVGVRTGDHRRRLDRGTRAHLRGQALSHRPGPRLA